jgi:hypothetical protein
MNSNLKNLAVLLTVAFLALFVWAVLQSESNSIQSQSTPIVTPELEFVVSIPQKALWKNYVTVSAEVPPETKCTLTYVSPLGAVHETNSTASATGLCIWKWKVDETEGKGAARLIFTINGASETHFMEIRSGF